MKISILMTFGLALFLHQGYSQKNILREDALLDMVRQYHPLSLQADMRIDMAEADVLKARAGFDPVLQAGTSEKELGNTTYYRYRQSEINIPTWYGIEVYTGIEQVGGLRTDPQETTGNSSYAGVSLSLLKGLLLDKRRASLQQAKVLAKQSETEKKVVLNHLLFEAAWHYWNWVSAYQRLKILNDAITVNESRVQFTRSMVTFGERPAIDTVEALVQLQSFEAQRNEMELEYRKAALMLSAFTWNENGRPVDLMDDFIPDVSYSYADSMKYMTYTFLELREQALQAHPELKIYQHKYDFLMIEKKLMFQELLPSLKVKYNQLGKNFDMISTVNQSLLNQNYNYGISFSMPLRVSQGRAEFRKAGLKLKQNELDLQLKIRQIDTKVQAGYTGLQNLQKQIDLMRNMLRNQTLLVQGEELRFQQGESTLFVLNSREQKKIETDLKLMEFVIKYYQQQAALMRDCGWMLK
ncbi:MAG: TolC family protein [Chitinophagaceae bacterium]|nr:TolC family protein [Chitinophagaceae bacterium]